MKYDYDKIEQMIGETVVFLDEDGESIIDTLSGVTICYGCLMYCNEGGSNWNSIFILGDKLTFLKD